MNYIIIIIIIIINCQILLKHKVFASQLLNKGP